MTDVCCPICESTEIERQKSGETIEAPSASDFMITDAAYGKTGPLFKCGECGFLFVVYPRDLTEYYSEMEDRPYEEGRAYRAIQQRVLLRRLKKHFPGVKSLLDVGAGTGILLEEAEKLGIESVGVEPSRWCAEVAESHGLNIVRGTVQNAELGNRVFDAVMAVDVIEHVSDPVGLLKSCGEHLGAGGAVVVVTPDVRSLVAKLLGRHWWHYRVAHVGYFSKKTLKTVLEKTGYHVVSIRRPGWYFEIGYLYQRLGNYIWLPKLDGTRNRFVRWLFSRKIPLNLGDSLEVIACKK